MQAGTFLNDTFTNKIPKSCKFQKNKIHKF